MRYRHEWKLEISYIDMLSIRSRLKAVAKPDPYAVDGRYFVRSLYFDNIDDKVLREKIAGVNCREKFRIRYYNYDPSFIRLEKKSKSNGLESKEQAVLTYGEASRIISGDTGWMLESEIPLLCEFYTKIQDTGLRPKTIVDYVREPYIYAPGNVRVTFDYDIRTGLWGTDLLDLSLVTIPVVNPGYIILEVKWDKFLPDIIRDCVRTPGRRTMAFSKYAQCRMFD